MANRTTRIALFMAVTTLLGSSDATMAQDYSISFTTWGGDVDVRSISTTWGDNDPWHIASMINFGGPKPAASFVLDGTVRLDLPDTEIGATAVRKDYRFVAVADLSGSFTVSAGYQLSNADLSITGTFTEPEGSGDSGFNDFEFFGDRLIGVGFSNCDAGECQATYTEIPIDEYGIMVDYALGSGAVFGMGGNATVDEVFGADIILSFENASKRAVVEPSFCSTTIFTGNLQKPDGSPAAYVLGDGLDTIVACGDMSDPHTVSAQIAGTGDQLPGGLWVADGKVFTVAVSDAQVFGVHDAGNSSIPLRVSSAEDSAAVLLAFDVETLELSFSKRIPGPAGQTTVDAASDVFGNGAVLSTYGEGADMRSQIAYFNTNGDTIQVFDDFGTGVQAQTISFVGTTALVAGRVLEGGTLNTINADLPNPPGGLPAAFLARIPMSAEVHQAFSPYATDFVNYFNGAQVESSQNIEAGAAAPPQTFAADHPITFSGQHTAYLDATTPGLYLHVDTFTVALEPVLSATTSIDARFVNATGSEDDIVVEVEDGLAPWSATIERTKGARVALHGPATGGLLVHISGAGSAERSSYRISEYGDIGPTSLTFIVTDALGKRAPGLLIYDAGGRQLSASVVTSIEPELRETGLTDLQLYPNPSDGDVSIAFTLNAPTQVTVDIVDATGRRVRRLAAGYRSADRHQLAWDGQNDSGIRVGAGVYFVVVDAADGRVTRPVTVVH